MQIDLLKLNYEKEIVINESCSFIQWQMLLGDKMYLSPEDRVNIW